MPRPIKRQRWSNIDVFGLMNGISTWDPQYRTLLYVRGAGDTPLDTRAKIFRTHNNPPSLTKQGVLNGISNEFALTPYNVESNNIFNLSNTPFPSGGIDTQDIWVQYRDVNSTGVWNNIYPQIWGQTYLANKESKTGFIVWQNEKYVNISGVKNFTYSDTLEILEDLSDNQELRITYYIRGTDTENNLVIKRFTDVDNTQDPYTKNYLYRKPADINSASGAVVYTLNDIPSGLYSKYYADDGFPLEQLYTLKEHINSKYRHTWDSMGDASVIWDVHKQYSSGNIPNFFDVSAPQNDIYYTPSYSGFIGGVEDLSHALYLDQIVESGEFQNWHFTLYPGRFYLDGTPFYMFENPSTQTLTFVNGEASIPSGLSRGAHVILATSGYYADSSLEADPYLNGYIFEDHMYPNGKDGDSTWSNIYRRKGFIPSGVGYTNVLDLGEYNIDFQNGKIYAQLLDPNATIIWENSIIPSGRVIAYDINPLNNTSFSKQKFFLYLVTKEQ